MRKIQPPENITFSLHRKERIEAASIGSLCDQCIVTKWSIVLQNSFANVNLPVDRFLIFLKLQLEVVLWIMRSCESEYFWNCPRYWKDKKWLLGSEQRQAFSFLLENWTCAVF